MTRSLLRRFLADQRGVTVIEYGLIVALISVVVIAGISAAGTALYSTLMNVSNKIK